MYKGTILLKYLTLILLIFLQTCSARKSKQQCPRSACGHIRDIRNPFRLNTDPKHCGFPEYELACEGNQTVLPLGFNYSFYVQAINYDNKTIHLVDPTLQTQNLCSIPQLTSLQQYSRIFDNYYYYYFYDDMKGYIERIAEPIFMFNCPLAVNSSSTFLEISGCKLSRHTYLKIGEMNASEVSDGCRVQLIGRTSWPNVKDIHNNNISLSDFHQAILYGFELSYQNLRFGRRISVIERIRWTILSLSQVFASKLLYPFRKLYVIWLDTDLHH